MPRKNNIVFVAYSSIHGKGLFANEAIATDSHIGTFKGIGTRTDGTYVLWHYDENDIYRGRRGTTPLRFLNHSISPNAEFDGFELYALTCIDAGEEITIDYDS